MRGDPSSLQRFTAVLRAKRAIGGFTFMGTVTIALPKAKSLSHQVSFNMIAAMTALYGVGQIAGPLIAGALYQIAASFNPALYAAALALLIAAGLVFTERRA